MSCKQSENYRAKETIHRKDLHSSIYEVAEGLDEAALREMSCIALVLVTWCYMQLFTFTKPDPENGCPLVCTSHTSTQWQLLMLFGDETRLLSAHRGQSPGHVRHPADVFIIIAGFACSHDCSLLRWEADAKDNYRPAAGRGLTGRPRAAAGRHSFTFRCAGTQIGSPCLTESGPMSIAKDQTAQIYLLKCRPARLI